MDKVSAIVPVYKVEKYLKRCVDSLTGQTYKNLEIILVDDGSPDNCGALCDELAKSDDRIVVFHRENQGVCAARNAGLDVMTGEWVFFCDSDDWYEPSFVEVMLNTAHEKNADLVICDYQLTWDNRPPMAGNNIADMKGRDARYIIACGLPYSHCRLISRDLILRSGVRYPLGIRQAEELSVIPVLAKYAHNIELVDQPLYNYYQRGDGTSASNSIPERAKFVEKSMNLMADALGEGYEKEVEYHAVYLLFYGEMLNMCKLKKSRKEILELLKIYEQRWPLYYKNPYIENFGFAKKLFIKFVKMHFILGLRLLSWVHGKIVG